ncbi:hypothetical protein M9Y10_017579 [Tritrichomonas musculus]|uniref:Glucosidase II subunit alpha n=1 Tax=Tritrichomonas musculus TaxID=1915356 RepID=A0ABR2GMZ0_9EUKA
MILFWVAIASSYEEYKKCKDMRFCYHNIDKINEWSLRNPNFDVEKYEFTADLLNFNETDNLKLIVYLMQNNSFRIRFIPTNHENFNRYKLAENSFVVNQEVINKHLPLSYDNQSDKLILISNECRAEIHLSPFYISISDKYNSMLYINYNQNLLFEHKGEKVTPDYWPYYMNDTIKNGATATGIDFSFRGKKTRITGFCETDNSLNFEDTIGEPLRMTNIDSFSDYGHVPLIHGHSASEMISFFWMNPTDTFLKISTDNDQDLRNVRLLSEGGYADFVVFTGKIFDILNSYTKLTGRHEIPPIFSIGYHQSKWGYKTQDEVEQIIDELDNRKFPLDAIWLDVDHLHNFQPFRFNLSAFPNPDSLFQKLSGQNRFLIRLNDPHLPDDDTHFQFKYAKEHGFLINESDGVTPFKGSCWPGPSFWPDFLNPTVHKWWSSLYKYQANESAPNVYFWNDMNEPTVFSSVEGTFPKENVYFNGYEYREVRNLYGILMHSATHEGLINRNDDRNIRPFVLSRSFFAGSQKYCWVWSGANEATYKHLRHSISMSIVSGLCGLPLTGADLGGFNGNTTPQLISRWHQAGAFSYPLFRSHCHRDMNHREPFLFDDSTYELLLNSTRRRYEAAPLWYTSIQNSHETGIPPVLPLFALYPEVENLHDVDDQFILGQSLMIAPIVDENAAKRTIIIPPGIWYNMTNGHKIGSASSTVSIDVNIESLPAFIKGGSIVPFFTDVGRNMKETMKSSLRLIVGCDEDGNARGDFYLDDGISFNYEKGEFLNRKIIFENNSIRIEKREPIEKSVPSDIENTYISEIVFYGLKSQPEKIGDDSIIQCNEEGDSCTMNNFKLYLKNVDNDDDNKKADGGKLSKKTLVIIIICCSLVGFIAVAIAIACIVICHLEPKKNEMNIEDVLIDDDQF